MAAVLITDAELLSLSMASDALNQLAQPVRDEHRKAASDRIRSSLAVRVSAAEADGFAPQRDVKEAVAARAAYTLLARRGYSPEAGVDRTVAARWEDTLVWLEAVRAGKAHVLGYPSDRQGAKVGGTDTSQWQDWRTGGIT